MVKNTTMTQTQLRKLKVIVDKFTLLIMAIKTCGTYDPDDVLPQFDEYLTSQENKILKSFLTYVHTNNLSFGRANVLDVGQDWVTA